MTVRIAHIFAILATTFLLSACGTKQETPAISGHGGEIANMVTAYNAIRAAGLGGNVDKFLALRDTVTMAAVRTYFGNIKAPIDSARVALWAGNWPPVDGLRVAQDTSDGQWRRLTFIKEGVIDVKGIEKIVYPVVIFRKDGDNWRVSNAMTMGSDKFDKQGNFVLLSQMTYHPLFQMPPSFDQLLEKPGDQSGQPPEEPTPVRIDPSKLIPPKRR